MCTVDMISLGSTLLGTGLTAAGQARQGRAAQAQADYRAAVAENDRILAERQAQDSLDRGELAEKRYRLQVAGLKGRQRAALAAAGVALDDGSALDVLADTAALGEQDALTIRNDALREAYGYRLQASRHGAEAGLLRTTGRASARDGLLHAGTTLLGGAGSVADKWYRYRGRV